ncbi:MAG: metallophosphoesterase family protein [Thermodesulfobacteriota bacterium]|nr:metallophosphoesterase family protein [Thermodesulfobacteriota bacterium]
MKRIGIISDTHGRIRQWALDVLKGAHMILHAGDIGSPDVIDELQALAPVVAVRGNMDKGAWSYDYNLTEALEIDNRFIYMIHDKAQLDLAPAGQFDTVISGHTHLPEATVKDGVLYFNPGSAGHRRFGKPVSIGILEISATGIEPHIIKMDDQ